MIDDILLDRTPGQKPRFFLHDEMTAWLTDNLHVRTQIKYNKSANYPLRQKLNLYDDLIVGLHIETEVSLSGTSMITSGSSVSLIENERAFQCLANVNETLMYQMTQLQGEISQLKADIAHLKQLSQP